MRFVSVDAMQNLAALAGGRGGRDLQPAAAGADRGALSRARNPAAARQRRHAPRQARPRRLRGDRACRGGPEAPRPRRPHPQPLCRSRKACPRRGRRRSASNASRARADLLELLGRCDDARCSACVRAERAGESARWAAAAPFRSAPTRKSPAAELQAARAGGVPRRQAHRARRGRGRRRPAPEALGLRVADAAARAGRRGDPRRAWRHERRGRSPAGASWSRGPTGQAEGLVGA